MICPKCLKENSETSKFCTVCGTSLKDAFDQNKVDSHPSDDKNVNSGYSGMDTDSPKDKQLRSDGVLLVEADKGTRFGNYLIDMIFVYICSFVVGLIIGASASHSYGGYAGRSNNSLVFYLIGFLIVFSYYTLMEGLTGRTIAKYITRTKVVDENGEKPDLNTILIRSLCRLIPFEQFSFLASGYSGWHDKFSKTRVVKA